MVGSLAGHGVRYLRMMRIAVYQPWYVLTISQPLDLSSIDQTYCIATDNDLADLVACVSRQHAVVRSLLCMLPGWRSSTGRWCSRDVQKVWIAHTANGDRVLTFQDMEGQVIDGQIEPSLASTDRRLALHIA